MASSPSRECEPRHASLDEALGCNKCQAASRYGLTLAKAASAAAECGFMLMPLTGMGSAQRETLRTVRQGAYTVRQLADALEWREARVHAVSKLLVERGLMRRLVGPKAMLLRITEAGHITLTRLGDL